MYGGLEVEEKLKSYGGQAVIEGVMMRGRTSCAIAVRTPDGSIEIENQELGGMYQSRIAQIPFLRGLLLLGDALVLGIRALTFSANVQVEEDEKVEGTSLFLTLLTSLAAGIGLFFLLPAGLAHLSESVIQVGPFWGNVIEGLVRLMLLIGYIWGIGRVPDIERVYGYHGAEHKTINAFEADAPLTVQSVATFSRQHARCGTAFMLTVVLFSIVLFSLLGPMTLWLRLLSRVLLVPVLAMIAYEYIRFTGKNSDRRWLKPLIAPNLALQRLTTREPEPGMIEVAIAAFHAMREQEPVEG